MQSTWTSPGRRTIDRNKIQILALVGSLAKFAAMRRISSRRSRLVAEQCDGAICRESGEKRKCATCA